MKLPNQTDIRAIHSEFAKRRKAQASRRRNAIHTLSPSAIRQAIKDGDLPPYQAILMGNKEDGSLFGIDDIKQFNKVRQAHRKKWGTNKGAPLNMLIVASRQIDVYRANTEIDAARLYKISGDLLYFDVTASGKHNETRYQVKIKLENWNDELTQTQRSWPATVKRILMGNVSIDCQCGRYQFWYRYLATAGGFALKPFEKDFPKVRNPSLTGCCCKHQLKVLGALKSPTVQAQLAKKLQEQSENAGFADSNTASFLTQAERDDLERARPRDVDKTAAQKIIQKMKQAKRVFKKQVKDPKYVKKLEAEVAKLRKQLAEKQKKQEKAEKAKVAQKAKEKAKQALKKKQAQSKNVNKDQLKALLRTEIDRAKLYGSTKENAIKVFAQLNNLTLTEAKQLAREL